jgi:hypothetical protein
VGEQAQSGGAAASESGPGLAAVQGRRSLIAAATSKNGDLVIDNPFSYNFVRKNKKDLEPRGVH